MTTEFVTEHLFTILSFFVVFNRAARGYPADNQRYSYSSHSLRTLVNNAVCTALGFTKAENIWLDERLQGHFCRQRGPELKAREVMFLS
jgi:hypothetical protein